MTKKYNTVIHCLFFSFFFFSGFARLPQTKIYGIQLFVIFAILLCFFGLKGVYKKAETPIYKIYKYFILCSIIPLLLGWFFNKTSSIYFFLYTMLPLFLYRVSNKYYYNYTNCLLTSELSLLITIFIGWLIYYRLIPYDSIYKDINLSEIELGYWGISYYGSSRNHDYMYPLVCASISLFFYFNTQYKKIKLFQFFIFILCEISLFASLSRGAIIIFIINIVLLIINMNKKERVYFVVFLILLVSYFSSTLLLSYNDTYHDIILSIFGAVSENKNGSKFSNVDRLIIYKNAIFHILINPIGYGIENYSIITSNYIIKGGSAENAYLTIFVERGWLAGFCFITFIIKSLKNAIKSNNKNLNFYLLPVLLVYFLFNYEFTSYMCVFVFYLILINYNKKNNVSNINNSTML